MHALVVGAVCAVVVFWLRTLPIVSDPYDYVRSGILFPDMEWNLVGTTRYGLILPLAVITSLFHDGEASFYLMPILASAALTGSAYWVARRSFGAVAGLVTVVLLLGASPVMLNATRLYPDIFSAASCAVAVAFALGTRDHWRRSPDARLRGVVLLVVTGLCVGLSWWMRETSVFAWPAVAVALLWKGGPPWRQVLLWAGGAAAFMFVLECVISQLVFDDPLARLNALTGSDMSTTTNPLDMPYLNKDRWEYMAVIPLQMLKLGDGPWLLGYGAVAILGGVLFSHKVGFHAFWFVSSLGLLVLAGGTLNPASPSLRLDLVRYWLPFLVPMIIAAVGTVATAVRAPSPVSDAVAAESRGRRILVGALGVALVLTPTLPTLHLVRNDTQFVVANGGVMNEFRDWLAAHDDEVSVMYADLASQRQLPTYTRDFWGRPLAEVQFERMTPDVLPTPGSHVVLFSDGRGECLFCADWMRQIREANPDLTDDWDLVWRSRDSVFEVYRVPD